MLTVDLSGEAAVVLAAAAPSTATMGCTDPGKAASTTGAAANASPTTASSGSDAATRGSAQLDVGQAAPSAMAFERRVPSPTAKVLHVPKARRPIRPKGHFRIELWDGAPSTGTLMDAQGKGAVPISESRFLWGDGMLYLFYYAGDLDLQARAVRHDGPTWNDDSVEFAFGPEADKKRVIRISVTGVVTDGICPSDALALSDSRCDLTWESGVHAATDADGTLNDITDRDEEWAVEAAIPLASLEVRANELHLRMSRCEIAHDGPRTCGSWDGTLLLDDESAADKKTRDGGGE